MKSGANTLYGMRSSFTFTEHIVYGSRLSSIHTRSAYGFLADVGYREHLNLRPNGVRMVKLHDTAVSTSRRPSNQANHSTFE